METEVATTAAHPTFWAGTIKPFLIAHPLGVTIVGGAIVGVGAYYIYKKFSGKKEEQPATA